MGDREELVVARLARLDEQLFRELGALPQVALDAEELPQSMQDEAESNGIASVLAQLTRAAVRALHLGHGVALRADERLAEGELQLQLERHVLLGWRKRFQRREPTTSERDRLRVREDVCCLACRGREVSRRIHEVPRGLEQQRQLRRH